MFFFLDAATTGDSVEREILPSPLCPSEKGYTEFFAESGFLRLKISEKSARSEVEEEMGSDRERERGQGKGREHLQRRKSN